MCKWTEYGVIIDTSKICEADKKWQWYQQEKNLLDTCKDIFIFPLLPVPVPLCEEITCHEYTTAVMWGWRKAAIRIRKNHPQTSFWTAELSTVAGSSGDF